MTTAQIREVAPGWVVFRDGCPAGETPEQVAARVDRVIVRSRAVDGDVVLFAHGHVLRVLAARWIGLSALGGQHFVLRTGAVSVLGFYREIPAVRVLECGSPQLAADIAVAPQPACIVAEASGRPLSSEEGQRQFVVELSTRAVAILPLARFRPAPTGTAEGFRIIRPADCSSAPSRSTKLAGESTCLSRAASALLHDDAPARASRFLLVGAASRGDRREAGLRELVTEVI